MIYKPRYRQQIYGQVEAVETGYTCPLCCNDVAWWKEEWDYDENNEICHIACLQAKKLADSDK